MLTRPQIDRLIALGRQRGSLEIGDIGAVIPVESLSIDEISHVMSVLEDAGISVEIDPAFLSPRHRNIDSPPIAPKASPAAPGGDATATQTRVSALESSATQPRKKAAEDKPPNAFPARPATVFVVIGAGIALIIVLVFWTYLSG